MSLLYLPFFVLFFLVAIFVGFYIPGRVILGKQKYLSILAVASLSLIIGFVLWGWQGYVFGYLNIRWMTYPYLFIFSLLFVRGGFYKPFLQKPKIRWRKIDWFTIAFIVIGALGQTFYYMRAGLMVPEGMLQVMYNVPDHIWHTSMISEMTQRIPPHEPGMYGILKTNYHYWFNLVTAELVRVFHLPLYQAQYIGMYLFGSVMLGVMAYVLSQLIFHSKVYGRWVLFFFYFGGDAAYWLTFISQRYFDFKTPSIIEHGALFMDNPPRAFSIIVALAAIYLLFKYIDKKYKNVFVLILLFGSLVGFKVYTGFGLMAGLAFLAAYHLFVKKNITTVVIVVIAAILSALVFFPVNAKSGGVFFLPFERPRDFITYKPLGFHDLEMRWRVFEEHNNIPRLIHLGIIMTAIYFIAQYGTKIIGFIPYKKTLQIFGREKLLFAYGVMVTTILIGIFFSQKAHVSDSFNFFLPATLFLNLFAALNLTLWMKGRNMIIQLLIILIVVGITTPRWFYNVGKFVPYIYAEKFNGLSHAELASYSFLRNSTPADSTVLVMNKYAFDSVSALVSIHSQRRMFLSGQGVIVAHDAVNEERERIVDRIYKSKNPKEVNEHLKNNGIQYIYFYGTPNLLAIPINKLEAREVFKNETATILQIAK